MSVLNTLVKATCIVCIYCEYNVDLPVRLHSATLCRPKSTPAEHHADLNMSAQLLSMSAQ